MRPIFIALFAAMMAAVCLPAASALAAGKSPPVSPEQKKQGMAAAPGIIKSAGLDCQLADARMMGTQVDPKTKVKSTFYEIACRNAEGYVVATKASGAPQIYTCLEAAAAKGASCVLPENADPKAGLAPLLAKADPSCQLVNARGIGHTADGTETDFEVACQDGSGYIVHTSYPMSVQKPVKLQPCFLLAMSGGTLQCTLTTPAQQTATFDAIVAKMGKPCDIKNRRVVGATADGSYFFEVACQDGKGYMVEMAANGQVKPAIDCAVADNIGGGCTLTNARQAQTEQAGLYTRLAQKAGFNCNVSKYAPFDVELPGHEVVELACSNRPDGAVAIFPASEAEPAHIYDCAHSELVGYRCSFTPASAADPNLTNDLKRLGKSTCAVSGSRSVGKTAGNIGYIEVACADGNPGYLISYTLPAMTPKEAIACVAAKDIVGGCQLPTNKRG
ncbi:MAG TPA: hypothetical protein VMU93_16440 [Caulobacteraceae bacterium]|nr:hypothetical protein [Caulobacteraceae bacterium]